MINKTNIINNIATQTIDKNGKISKDSANADFAANLQAVLTAESDESPIESYRQSLMERFGNVRIQNVGNDQSSMDELGMGTIGSGNVVIAPNILEEMANNPQKAEFYEKAIAHHFDHLPILRAEMAAMNHRITSCGVVIHPNGEVTYYVSGEETPEYKAKVAAENKAKQERKAAKQKEAEEAAQEMFAKQMQMLEMGYQQRAFELASKRASLTQNLGLSTNLDSLIAAYQSQAQNLSQYKRRDDEA